MKLLPVQSTVVVTSTLVELFLAHVKHVLVLTAKLPPLGTSGVRVVVSVTTKSSKSTCRFSSTRMHCADLGPTGALRGLMYLYVLVSRFEPDFCGAQSPICRSAGAEDLCYELYFVASACFKHAREWLSNAHQSVAYHSRGNRA